MAIINYSGTLIGVAYTDATLELDYYETPDPPAASGVSKYNIILRNQSSYPYKTPTDKIMCDVTILKQGRPSYLANQTVDLWMNNSGTWQCMQTESTDRNGIAKFICPTVGFPTINNCLSMARATIDDITLNSNVARINLTPQ